MMAPQCLLGALLGKIAASAPARIHAHAILKASTSAVQQSGSVPWARIGVGDNRDPFKP